MKHVFKQSGTKLVIRGDRLEEIKRTPAPILWDNDGLERIIPVERVVNQLSVHKDCATQWASLDIDLPYEEVLVFNWDETEDI